MRYKKVFTTAATFFFIFLFSASVLFAQKNEKCKISGQVISKEEKEPVFGVVALIEELNNWFVTDENGYFVLDKIPPGEYKLLFKRMGIQNKEITVKLKSGEHREISVEVNYQNLNVDEVVVTAKENRNKMSNVSTVESQAIEHIQASSLKDIMQLLPGQEALNPDLNKSNQASLRGISSDAVEEKLDAMGTAIIMDGAPVSNNANMQASNTAEIGAEGFFSTVTGGGVDLRQIPTDNVESVEIIKGIASVKHGDLTSGAIVVNTKASVTPFIGKIKFNPHIKQAYLGKGVKLSDDGGSLNLDLDYAYSQQDVRKPNPSYNRLNGQATYSNTFWDSRWYSTSKFTFSRSHDKDRDDSDQASLEKRYSTDVGLRFSTSGKVKIHRETSGCINYNLTTSYTKQTSYNRSLISRSIQPLPTATIDTTYEVEYLPSEYYSATRVDGKPFNLFANLEYRAHFKSGETHHRIVFGSDYKIDANWGDGRSYDPEYYPSSSQRPRSFKDIPALNQFSLYMENKISSKLFERALRMQAGFRFDNIQPKGIFNGKFGQALLPRANIAYNIFDEICLRGGYGISAKAPSLIYLYPDYAYFDPQSFNMYSSTYPEESLAMITTKVFEPDNSNLELAVMNKYEFGFDINLDGNSFNMTYYKENLSNGYNFEDILGVVNYPVYDIYSYIPGQGEQPVLDYTNVDTSILRETYKAPVNSRSVKREGIELAYSSNKFGSLGTRLNLTGAWTKSKTTSDVEDIYVKSQYKQGNNDRLIGIYNTNGRERERLLTTLRVIQHIPQIRFVATFSIQTQWLQKTKVDINNEHPIGYVDPEGKVEYLTSEESHSEEYSFLKRDFDETYYYNVDKPSLWHISLKLTKELENGLSFSFYANNMFMNHPAYKNIKSGLIEKRNPELFFGAELKFKI